jgi:hypothetical protein
MNQKEWRYLCDNHKELLDFTHYNNTRKIQKSLQYNTDPNAKVIHHLRDTEEQRKYNDEHYELWGHNLDGTFEYGKYVTFVTEEWHSDYHKHSEETRKKMSDSRKGEKCYWYGKHRDTTTKEKLNIACKGKTSGKNNGMYGKRHSDEAKEKLRNANLGKKHSDETKKKISESNKLNYTDERRQSISAANKGKKLSDETKKKISDANKGKTHSDETKKLLSEIHKNRYKNMTTEEREHLGHTFSDEQKQHISNALKGRSLSDEHKKHISDSLKGRILSDETRAKISASNKGRKLPPLSNEAKAIISEKSKESLAIVKELYMLHKQSGGTLKWNDFQRQVKMLYPERFEQ